MCYDGSSEDGSQVDIGMLLMGTRGALLGLGVQQGDVETDERGRNRVYQEKGDQYGGEGRAMTEEQRI